MVRLFSITAIATAALLCMVTLNKLTAADAGGYKYYSTQATFEDVLQDLKDEIIDRGLVIDFVGHVDTMLERTSSAAGSVTKTGKASPYLHAKYLQFCSARLAHEAMSANPFNLSVCPYVVFVFESRSQPGKIIVGYRRSMAGPSKRTREA
ncbi:MAG: DUF302 domain-containing protein, partial [Hyphomicrobiaceae bacterium]